MGKPEALPETDFFKDFAQRAVCQLFIAQNHYPHKLLFFKRLKQAKKGLM